ncbi:MAG: HAD hydrolase-like protein [Lachnospiraceae bacterium]|nr:HAD hydrolase-like protein [Lachnospiraceae bacterium]
MILPLTTMKYTEAFFDLDGTITDSGKVIMECAAYSLRFFGYEDQPEEKLRKFVGPSLMDSFQTLYGMSEDEARKATGIYRGLYETDKMYDVTIYDGIVELLSSCRKAGISCYVITSKVEASAKQIIKKFDLDRYFTDVIGPDPCDPSSDKKRLIERAIDRYSLDRNHCIMIGDTHFDIDGAVGAGIDSIAVTYGYGDLSSLEKAGPKYIATEPAEVWEVLRD